MDNSLTLTPFSIATSGWGEVGDHLLRAEAIQSWSGHAASLSEWIRELAVQRGCTPTLLWRWKSAAKFYNSRRELLASRGVRLPEVSAISPSVSAESIELLAKIERVAPADVFDGLEVPALRGALPKKELKAVWEAYSPLLEGRTGRGRGVKAPRVGHDASRGESDLLLGLRRSKGNWLSPSPKLYEVYGGIEVSNEVRASHFICDAVILARTNRHSPLEIHGIEMPGALGPGRIKDRTIRWLEQTVDFGWIVLSTTSAQDEYGAVPAQLGVLEVQVSGGVRVARPAVQLKRERTSAEMLARDLLARAMRWWK